MGIVEKAPKKMSEDILKIKIIAGKRIRKD